MEANTLIFSDLDGTIIDDSYKINPELINLLHNDSKNINLVIVTSRGWDGLKPFSKELNLSLPQIVENGAKIIDPQSEKIIYQSNINQLSLQQIALISETNSLKVGFSAGYQSYSEINLIEKIKNIGRISLKVPNTGLSKVEKELNKISDIQYIKDRLPQSPDIYLIDIQKKGVTKLTGVKNWLKRYKKAVNFIYIAGNSPSDIDLFRLNSSNKVVRLAVVDGDSELKSLSDKIIPSAKELGFYQFLLASYN